MGRVEKRKLGKTEEESFLAESEGDSHFSAVRRVVSFPEFSCRGG